MQGRSTHSTKWKQNVGFLYFSLKRSATTEQGWRGEEADAVFLYYIIMICKQRGKDVRTTTGTICLPFSLTEIAAASPPQEFRNQKYSPCWKCRINMQWKQWNLVRQNITNDLTRKRRIGNENATSKEVVRGLSVIGISCMHRAISFCPRHGSHTFKSTMVDIAYCIICLVIDGNAQVSPMLVHDILQHEAKHQWYSSILFSPSLFSFFSNIITPSIPSFHFPLFI